MPRVPTMSFKARAMRPTMPEERLNGSIIIKFRVACFPSTSKSGVCWDPTSEASPIYTAVLTVSGLCISQQALSAHACFQFPTIIDVGKSWECWRLGQQGTTIGAHQGCQQA